MPFKLWLISGTNAVYSCKKAGFTLMCKDLDNDEAGAWKRCKEKILSKCHGTSTWLSSIANWFSFFEWSFLLNCVTSFWASNAKLTEASETFLLHFRCKGEEFTMDCFANSTWLPQVELQCKECQGKECDGSQKSEWSLTISCFPIESERAAVAKFYFQSHVGFCLPLNCVKF